MIVCLVRVCVRMPLYACMLMCARVSVCPRACVLCAHARATEDDTWARVRVQARLRVHVCTRLLKAHKCVHACTAACAGLKVSQIG